MSFVCGHNKIVYNCKYCYRSKKKNYWECPRCLIDYDNSIYKCFMCGILHCNVHVMKENIDVGFLSNVIDNPWHKPVGDLGNNSGNKPVSNSGNKPVENLENNSGNKPVGSLKNDPDVDKMISGKKIENNRDTECVVCMENRRNVVLKNCGHTCMCHDCAYKQTKCPICRKDYSVKNIIKIYF